MITGDQIVAEIPSVLSDPDRILPGMANKNVLLQCLAIAVLLGFACANTGTNLNRGSAATQMTFGAFSRASETAARGVVRVVCVSTQHQGTGFAYHSVVITAAHVLDYCATEAIRLIHPDGRTIGAESVRFALGQDLASVVPLQPIPSVFELWQGTVAVGEPVATWGFPGGYGGMLPLLSAGYLAGIDPGPKRSANATRLFINAAFNSGNSGGPLIRVEDGTVLGVVVSKLAPIPSHLAGALEMLRKNTSGLHSGFAKQRPDGTTERVSDAQVVAEILTYLRSQTQLVVGLAVPADRVREFVKEQGIE